MNEFMRCPGRPHLSAITLQATLLLLATTAPTHAATPTRADFVQELQRVEGLVDSVTSEFTRVRSATTPDMARRIEELARVRGDEHMVKTYVVTPDRAARQNAYVKWRRSSRSERRESYPLTAAGAPGSTAAEKIETFNGQISNALEVNNEKVGGYIGPESEWNSINIPHPMSFALEYYNVPFSKLIESAKDLQIERESERGGGAAYRVRFAHPEHDSRRLELFFDESLRCVGRDLLVKLSADPSHRIHERHALSDFRQATGPNGEQVWFPMQADYTYLAGSSPDGTHIEWASETYRVLKLDLNPPIEPGLFTLEYPPGAKVWDAVSGMDFVSGDVGNQITEKFVVNSSDSSERRTEMIVAGLSVLVLACLILWLVVRAKKLGGPG